MKDQSVVHSTFVIERSFPVTAERVFSAFSDPAKKRRWFADSEGKQVLEFQMDFRVGGKECSRFLFEGDSPIQGIECSNHTTYQDIEPNRRIVIAYTMSLGDKRISASLATFEFLPTQKGTDLIFTEQAAFFEGADGPEMREAGWIKLLDELIYLIDELAQQVDDLIQDLDLA
jgi:uncharacterized protein YndB with AHSA1/START domain